ncbi:hypothetical protein E4U60_001861 [Claviceps pazoutovae]|uniref:Uncharacterized protein n=1 Tax=Claviceps pazoutovae TaxID=1649127 RepID=A0A9P7SL80_9HYPO|nr:hypothetical protein E4U60_001861 [Claviceps pazoutovae]
MREILTLQLGNLSNYTATHFWNAQESYFTYGEHEESVVDHNVHFRPGTGADGSETFLPRTVIYDLKGGFGSLRKINPLYDASSNSAPVAASLWSGDAAVHKQQPLKPSAYQESLDAGIQPAPLTASHVRYWSDYSRTYFHPRSAVQLYDFELNSSIRPFENFSMGTELFSSLDREQDIVDRDWRPFVEECDLMQGMQVFASLDDAWGGFGASYLEYLRDEYPKSCIWVWGAQSPITDVPREKRQLRTANIAQSLYEGYSQASIIVPMALPPETSSAPFTRLDRTAPWHTAAVFAAMAESSSIFSRLKGSSGHVSMSDMAERLNTGGTQVVVSAGMSPFPEPAETDGEKETVSLFHVGGATGTETKERRNRIFGQITGCRGPLHENMAKGTPESPQWNRIGNPVIQRYDTSLEFPLLDSYPRIYTSAASKSCMPLNTFLRTDTSICVQLRALRAQATRRLISLDEREGLSNGIAEMADAYQDDWSSGSDNDDDDL